MATNRDRVMISVPKGIEAEVERLDQTMFCDRLHTGIHRQSIKLGPERISEGEKTVREGIE